MSYDTDWAMIDKSRFYAYSTVGLVGSRLALYPPMLLKTRMQTQTSHEGMAATARSLLAKEGLRGLYRGALAVSIGVVPTQSVYVTALEVSKSFVKQQMAPLEGYEPLQRMTAAFVAGGLASCVSASLGVPLDVVTQKMQIGTARDTVGHVVRTIWQQQGLRGFYKGYLASLTVYAPTSSVWWTTYSNTCALLGKDDRDAYVATMWRSSVAGAVAGLTAAIVTNPLDVCKTRIQTMTANRSMLAVAKELYAKEGARGFLRGSSARCAAMAPTSMLMIFSFETVKRMARKES